MRGIWSARSLVLPLKPYYRVSYPSGVSSQQGKESREFHSSLSHQEGEGIAPQIRNGKASDENDGIELDHKDF